MEDVPKRLRFVREQLASSARKLSIELGLAPNGWGQYEAGGHLPGAAILASLSKRGVDLNWLLTGEGQPFRASASSGIDAVVDRLEQQQTNSLKLGRLTILAARSHLALEQQILTLLAKAHGGLSLGELAAELDIDDVQIAAVILKLLNAGQIISNENGVERYELADEIMLNAAAGLEDKAHVCLSTVKYLVNELAPQLESAPDNAVLLDGVASVADGQKFLATLLSSLKVAIGQAKADEGELVRIVFAASIGTK